VKSEGKYTARPEAAGQYGHVWLKVRPNRARGSSFKSSVVGGAHPARVHRAGRKGHREALEGGVLAATPWSTWRPRLFDGSYHEVDSNEMAFKIAGSIGSRRGPAGGTHPARADDGDRGHRPRTVMGNVIGDLSARRGKILGMEKRAGTAVVSAHVPRRRCSATPRRCARDRGPRHYTMQFHHYAAVRGAHREQ